MQPVIEVTGQNVVYGDPTSERPHGHGFYPGVARFPSGSLVALFAVSEYPGSEDETTYVARSVDRGRQWELIGPLFDKAEAGLPYSSDYLKPTALSDGSGIAMGYRFLRENADQPVVNPETDGLVPGENVVAFSTDEGQTWSTPRALGLTRPEFLELPGGCVQLRNGDIVASGYPFPAWDGTSTSGNIGILLRSTDMGKTWDDRTLFYQSPEGKVAPYESRLCEMQDGRIVALVWAFDMDAHSSLTNQVTVSHDNGMTWSEPIDTGISSQASNVLWLGGDRLLTIHCHRESDVGLYVRVVDFAGDRWKVLKEKNIWDRTTAQAFVGLGSEESGLKFGQPSLLSLGEDILATHWAFEDDRGRILTHRLRLNLDEL